MAAIQTYAPATMNTRESHDYVRSRALFEHLIAKCGLKPIWKGEGHKTVMYKTSEIETALNVLRLNGGWDAEHDCELTKAPH